MIYTPPSGGLRNAGEGDGEGKEGRGVQTTCLKEGEMEGRNRRKSDVFTGRKGQQKKLKYGVKGMKKKDQEREID